MTLRVLIVDDSNLQCTLWKDFLESRYGKKVRVETYNDPKIAILELRSDVSLLLLDWQMPGLDGTQVLKEARKRGVDPKKVIILSYRPANQLHSAFPMGECLAAIEKGHPDQQTAFVKILDDMIV